MKKSLIVFGICFLVIIGFILFNNRTVSTITLDINPSILIDLNKKNYVKNVKALNDDAKDIVSNDLMGKSLDDSIAIIAKNILEKGYVDDNQVTILLYSTGNVNNNELKNIVGNHFGEQSIATNIIIVDNISKRDKEIAKKYNISPAKASYINSILDSNSNIDVANLVDESIRGLNETKNNGKYCEKGYNLEGDWCFKEIDRKPAKSGEICAYGYLEYKGKCYEEIPIEHTDKLLCRDDFSLENNKCIKTVTMNAEPVKYYCPSGKEMTNYEVGITEKDAENANDIVCVDTSNAKHPVSPCETHDGTEYTKSGGKCYWHRAPVIATGCPGKVQVNGMCWDDASNILICEGDRDGKRYTSRDEYCIKSIIITQPIVSEYKCENDYRLEGSKCLKDEVEDAYNELLCPNGYFKVNNDRCINKNKMVNKKKGLVCEYDASKLKGNICIIYNIVEAKNS